MSNVLVSATLSGALFASGLAIAGPAMSEAVPTLGTLPENPDATKVESDLSRLRDEFGETLVAIGRIDAILVDGAFTMLGQHVQSSPVALSVGDYVAVIGSPAEQGNIYPSAVIALKKQYVPGSSSVYLRALIDSGISSSGMSTLGSQVVDLTPSFSAGVPVGWGAASGEIAEVSGVQPALEGSILVTALTVVPTGAVSVTPVAGKTDGSLGTGKTDGSRGTGKTDASVGTGKTDASVGTGKTDASVGTGKTDASVGTGKTDASVGTGKTDASVGTGKTDASVGTGKTDASVGTGKTDGFAVAD
jgi:hypothetical protein